MKTVLFNLSDEQEKVIAASGHLLVVGGPGAGKTTVSILKAEQITKELEPGQQILFLSFARATVSRILETLGQHSEITKHVKSQIEVDTYHSFFLKIIKTHGYLIGLPKKITVLSPSAEAVALSTIRFKYNAGSKLSAAQKEEKNPKVQEEKVRLATSEGRLCFDLFAGYASQVLNGSDKIRKLFSSAYPYIVLDEFQDTNAEQWNVVKALGRNSTLVSLADPKQRIYDFMGADPERLNHFRKEFSPKVIDLGDANHRSKGTGISLFANDMFEGQYSNFYNGIKIITFEANPNQAFSSLKYYTLNAHKRLIDNGKPDWALAILVPTKKMVCDVSNSFKKDPSIHHTATIDMHGAILAAEIIGFFLQSRGGIHDEHLFIELLCNFFQGKGGENPRKTDISKAVNIRKRYLEALDCRKLGEPIQNKIITSILQVYDVINKIVLSGAPDADWKSIQGCLENCVCDELKQVAKEACDLRPLNLRNRLCEVLAQSWRDYGFYANAMDIVKSFFIQEHFSTATKPESGVVIMNMHKAKGKQFDEVIIFEGWPRVYKGKIKGNPDRIVKGNSRGQDLIHYMY